MPTIKKQTIKKGFGDPLVDNDLISHANDPFVLKKVADAKDFFLKNGLHGLPEHLKK